MEKVELFINFTHNFNEKIIIKKRVNLGQGQNLGRYFKISNANIKITKEELFHFFIYEFIFLFLKMKLENVRNFLFFYL